VKTPARSAAPAARPRLESARPFARTKLKVGDAHSPFEQEADRVARQVMRMSAAGASGPPGRDFSSVPLFPELRAAGVAVNRASREAQRMCSTCTGQDEEVQRAPSSPDHPEATADVAASIGALRGSGQSLPADVRSFFEPRFGHDFGSVRIHDDARAAELSRSVSARAFTVGNDIVFGASEYAPRSEAGRSLLAHELTHTIQQTGGAPGTAKAANARPAALSIARVPIGSIQRVPTISGWTFRNTGRTDAANCCALCPQNLGVNAAPFHNGMELQAAISGHAAGATYDIKRTKERSTWERVGGAWTNLTHEGPGAPDDAHNNDECLTPSGTPPKIYVVDVPGMQPAYLAGRTAGATDVVYKASFIEFVEIGGPAGGSTSGNIFNWHTITWANKPAGTWVVNAANSEIAPGAVPVGTASP
jgi:hypothetical protein